MKLHRNQALGSVLASILVATGLFSSTLLAAPPLKLNAKAPDLVVTGPKKMSAKVQVKNIGSAASGASYLTIKCKKVGGGSCAESPGMAAYEQPAYPNKVAVKIPPLAPGAGHTHILTFWAGLVWAPGTYRFYMKADDGNLVAETNEANNKKTRKLVAP